MGLMPPYFNSYASSRAKPRVKTASQLRAEAEYAKFLKSVGVRGVTAGTQRKLLRAEKEQMSAALPALSNAIPAGVASKRSILTDHEWRRDSGESAGTVDAIREKASRAMPLYNKGGYQLVSKSEDPATLGSRSRRG
jgi:hypothetical protein